MRPILAIPSYKRPFSKIFSKLEHLKIEKYVFVRPEEEEVYQKTASSFGFTVVPLSDVGDIGSTRKRIVEWCSKNHKEWAFMFDDDISKVECLSQKGDKITAERILYHPEKAPGFETKALKKWFNYARKYNLSLSSPNHRAYDRFSHGVLRINSSACIQCVLLCIPDIIAVGNYASLREVGNEDYYIQYRLMSSGKRTGKIGCVEYDCPEVGVGKGGNNAEEYSDIQKRYEEYVNTFLSNVCNDPRKVSVKTTSSGQKSIQFLWRNWDGKESIPLPGFSVKGE